MSTPSQLEDELLIIEGLTRDQRAQIRAALDRHTVRIEQLYEKVKTALDDEQHGWGMFTDYVVYDAINSMRKRLARIFTT